MRGLDTVETPPPLSRSPNFSDRGFLFALVRNPAWLREPLRKRVDFAAHNLSPKFPFFSLEPRILSEPCPPAWGAKSTPP